MSSNSNPEEAFLQRIQTYIANLELSNSELETQLQTLRSDLHQSHLLSQQLQSQNVGVLDKNQELEARKRVIDLFLELRNQEKEIYIKNIDVFLSRMQQMGGKGEEEKQNVEKIRNENHVFRVKIEELLLENQQLRETLQNRDQLFTREREFLRAAKNSIESELHREKEKSQAFQQQLMSIQNEIESMRQREKAFDEERMSQKGMIQSMEENRKRLDTICMAKDDELQRRNQVFERTMGKYEEDLKEFVGEFQKLKEDIEEKNSIIARSNEEIRELKSEKTRIQEDLQKKIDVLTEDLQGFKEDEQFLAGIVCLSNEKIKKLDVFAVVNKLQKGYLLERNRALNNGQRLRNLKRALEEKYKVLFEKYEEWKDFVKNHEDLKKNQELQRKKIKDLTQERDLLRFERSENAKKVKGLEKEKQEILKTLGSFKRNGDNSDRMQELIERNIEMQRKLEEIYEDSYAGMI